MDWCSFTPVLGCLFGSVLAWQREERRCPDAVQKISSRREEGADGVRGSVVGSFVFACKYTMCTD